MTVAYEHCVTMKHFRFRVINCIYLFPNVWVFEIYVWVLWKLRPRQTYKASLNVIIKCNITEEQTFWTKLFIFFFFPSFFSLISFSFLSPFFLSAIFSFLHVLFFPFFLLQLPFLFRFPFFYQKQRNKYQINFLQSTYNCD